MKSSRIIFIFFLSLSVFKILSVTERKSSLKKFKYPGTVILTQVSTVKDNLRGKITQYHKNAANIIAISYKTIITIISEETCVDWM